MKKLLVFWVIALSCWCFATYGSRSATDLALSEHNCAAMNSLFLVNAQDTIIFDFSDAFCTAGYMQVPVRFSSDDLIYAMDFALHFDPGVFSYISIVNHKAYLSYAASYNSSDSTLRFSSYSFQPMDNNTNLISIRFSLPVSQIDFAQFDSVYTLLNGDNCSSKAIPSIPPPVITAGGPTTIFPGDSLSLSIHPIPGFTYLWSNGEIDSIIYVNGPGTYSINAFYPNGCNSISFITISPPDPLPIQLLDFEATNASNGIYVEWSTATEINNQLFILEHAPDGHNWLDLWQVPGAGNSTNIKNYSFLDSSPFEGWNYYRLKQIDFDGHFTFSNVISEKLQRDADELSDLLIYPNPLKDRNLHFHFKNTFGSDEAIVKMYNNLGKEILSTTLKLYSIPDGNFTSEMNIDDKFISGIYTVVVILNSNSFTRQLIVY